jgi:hypothetical protein
MHNSVRVCFGVCVCGRIHVCGFSMHTGKVKIFIYLFIFVGRSVVNTFFF